MYTLDQLHAFVCVCECGSISAAARKLGKAQSGVSLAIANLEIELNQTLFERSQNAATLTEQGKALLPMVTHLLQENRLFAQRAAALTRREEHHLAIAIEDSLWNEAFTALLAQVQQRFPHTNLDLHAATAQEIESHILNGSIHLGITYHHQPQRQFHARALGTQAFSVIAGRRHPLVQQRNIGLDDLAKHCQLVYHIADTPILSPNVWRVNSYFLMMDMAEAAMGWAIVPHSLLADEAWENITELPLAQNIAGAAHTITALTALGYQPGEVTAFLLAALQNVFARQ